jgi:hypothetical protein
MIGHETVRPHLDSGLARLLSQQISINFLVAILKKDRLPTISTLRNVMRKAGNHRTRQSCHGEKLTRMTEPGIGIMSPHLPRHSTQTHSLIFSAVRPEGELPARPRVPS